MEEIKKMHSSLTFSWRPIALLAVFALVVAACTPGTATTRPSVGGSAASPGGGAASPTAEETDAASPTAEETDAASPTAEETDAASPTAEETDAASPSEDASEDAASPSEDASGGGGGSVDLTGSSFTVGSKEFTEQLILGHITIQVLEAAGAEVTDQTGLVGSPVVREALTSDEIDMYWEYTGTGWITHLGNDAPVDGAQEQFDAVKEADAANGIVWLDPAPFDNNYAIALASETATELGLTTLSELAAYAAENPEGATLCGASEFLNRDDGLPGLEAAYGFEFSDVSELELGLVYTSTDAGDPCVFGEVFATDGRILSLDLTVLEDDLGFFGTYLPSLNVRQEVLDANPELADLFAPIATALDMETMQTLNGRVDVDGENEADVAAAFLLEQGLVSE